MVLKISCTYLTEVPLVLPPTQYCLHVWKNSSLHQSEYNLSIYLGFSEIFSELKLLGRAGSIFSLDPNKKLFLNAK